MNDPGRVVIVGAGPAGLGAAYRLEELGHVDYVILEARDHPGGLATSVIDARGFTWDVGGHVHFSHYDYYDRVVDQLLGDRRVYREREAWIWFKGRFVPYPFQYNLRYLDPEDRDHAVTELRRVATNRARPARNFDGWIEQTFGAGIAGLFMRPYNEKVWGYPLETLGIDWIGDRVAVPDIDRVEGNIREGRDDVGWGPNNRFAYPLEGGTGALWQALARALPEGRIVFDTSVHLVDLANRTLGVSDGRRLSFDTLVSTMPLDRLCAASTGLDATSRASARGFVHSAVHIVGIGLRYGRPSALDTKCWMYFPSGRSPYHRVTVLSNYSPRNVPAGDGYWSLMAEVTETPTRTVSERRVVEEVAEALRRDGLVTRDAKVVSTWYRREEYGYPTPFLGRDDRLAVLLPALERHRVFSRGRFGAWRYEVSNQDHSFMQGVEVVNRLVGVGEEITIRQPQVVNRPRRTPS